MFYNFKSHTITPNEPVSATMPDKALDYILRETVVEGQSVEETYRQIAMKAWESAHQAHTSRSLNLGDVIRNYGVHTEELMKRINVFREVVKNTMKKMTTSTPSEFYWANYNLGDLAIQGFYIKQGNNYPQFVNQNFEIVRDTFKLRDSTFLRVVANFRGEILNIDTPAYLLNNDPIAIAQWVRQSFKYHDNTVQRENIRKVADDIKSTEAALKEAQNKLDTLKKQQEKLHNPKVKGKKKKTPKPVEV